MHSALRVILPIAALVVSVVTFAYHHVGQRPALVRSPTWTNVRTRYLELERRLDECDANSPTQSYMGEHGHSDTLQILIRQIDQLENRARGLGAVLGATPYVLLGARWMDRDEADVADWYFSVQYHSRIAADETLGIKMRLGAVRSLMKLQAMTMVSHKLVPSLLRSFRNSERPIDRRRILMALQGVRDPDIRTTAMDSLLYEDDVDTRRLAVSVLSSWKQESDIRAAIIHAREADPARSVRREAAKVLGDG